MRYIIIISFSIVLLFSSFIEKKENKTDEIRLASMVYDFVSIKYSQHKIKEFVYVGIKRQKIYLISDSIVLLSYSVSTSKYGAGSEKNSEKTPTGLHKIKSKIGKDAPLGGIILGSNYTGKQAEIIEEEKPSTTDDVTTRALRLEGLENNINKGGNKDSYSRSIYIHGTPEEGLIGKPASHGCVRMKNNEVIELFDQVKEGTFVIILNN